MKDTDGQAGSVWSQPKHDSLPIHTLRSRSPNPPHGDNLGPTTSRRSRISNSQANSEPRMDRIESRNSLGQRKSRRSIRSETSAGDGLGEDQALPDEIEKPAATKTLPEPEEVTILRLIAHHAVLIPASFVGVLIRLGLVAMATYDGKVVFALIWAQGIGCIIMGSALFRKDEIIALYPPIYTALTVGLAGSITTFSSWMLEGYTAFSNLDGYSRSGFYDLVDGLAYSIVTFGFSQAALRAGEYTSSLLPPIPLPQPKVTETDPSSSTNSSNLQSKDETTPTPSAPLPAYKSQNTLADIFLISISILCYIAALLIYFLAPPRWRHDITFPLVLAPPGAILRYLLARLNLLQPFTGRFPLGTFAANIIATLVLAGVFVAQSTALPGSRKCNALYGIEEGFCGCLSTVSTFVVESRSIGRHGWRWGYIFGSVILGHVLVLAIVGGSGWSREGGLAPSCKK